MLHLAHNSRAGWHADVANGGGHKAAAGHEEASAAHQHALTLLPGEVHATALNLLFSALNQPLTNLH